MLEHVYVSFHPYHTRIAAIYIYLERLSLYVFLHNLEQAVIKADRNTATPIARRHRLKALQYFA